MDEDDMDVPEPDDTFNDDDDDGAIQYVHRPVVPTWAELFDERYSDVFGWVGTADKARRVLWEYERATDTFYVPYKLSRELGQSG